MSSEGMRRQCPPLPFSWVCAGQASLSSSSLAFSLRDPKSQVSKPVGITTSYSRENGFESRSAKTRDLKISNLFSETLTVKINQSHHTIVFLLAFASVLETYYGQQLVVID